MKATPIFCDMFGIEKLYKVQYNGRIHDTPLSGKMSYHICDIINNGKLGLKRLKWSCSRNYRRRVITATRHVLAPASTPKTI